MDVEEQYVIGMLLIIFVKISQQAVELGDQLQSLKCLIGVQIQLDQGLMVYNFATAIRVTRPHIVTFRAVAQGRTVIGATRTSCGVVLLMVHPTPTVTA